MEPAERTLLLASCVRRSFAADELLLRQGDPTDHVLIILVGWVRVCSCTPEGQDVLVALRGPGDVLGDLAAVHGWARTASVRTLEEVTAVQLKSAQFVAMLRNRPNIALAMVKQISARLREAEGARVDFAMLGVTGRVAGYLLQLAEQHGVDEPAGRTVRTPLTQQDIANRVGASRRAVARAMAVLRERRIVTTGKRLVVIARPDLLEVFARSEPSGTPRV